MYTPKSILYLLLAMAAVVFVTMLIMNGVREGLADPGDEVTPAVLQRASAAAGTTITREMMIKAMKELNKTAEQVLIELETPVIPGKALSRTPPPFLTHMMACTLAKDQSEACKLSRLRTIANYNGECELMATHMLEALQNIRNQQTTK